MQKHEANLIKLAAALTAAPRWVTALIPADHARFLWGDTLWWSVLSACLSVLFALVETYAASFIMRASRQCQPGSDAERVLGALWVAILMVLTCIMAPAIYVSTTGMNFAALPGWLLAGWSVCVGASTFLVIGGVGYSEKQIMPVKSQSAGNLQTFSVSLPELAKPAEMPLPESAQEPKSWRQLTEAERQQVVELTVEEIQERYHVSERTARNWRNH